jgi:copper chaperone CopZ
VAAFIFFPDYVAALTRGERAGPTSTLESGRTLIFDVQGMTCEGCAATLRNRLVKIEGVADVRVHYAQRIAEVHAAGDHVSDRVTAAVAELGYTATPR